MKTKLISLSASFLALGLTVAALGTGVRPQRPSLPVTTVEHPVVLPVVVVRPPSHELIAMQVLPTVTVRPATAPRAPLIYAGSRLVRD